MSDGLSLVGVVAATRVQAALLIPVGLVSSLPSAVGRSDGVGPVSRLLLEALIIGLPMAAFAGHGRRGWHRLRLEQATNVPERATVIPRAQTFDLLSKALTKPLCLALAVGLFLSYWTGIPVGTALVGFACGLLWQAHRLARVERQRNIWLLCPRAPFRVQADDPHIDLYRQVPYYITAPSN